MCVSAFSSLFVVRLQQQRTVVEKSCVRVCVCGCVDESLVVRIVVVVVVVVVDRGMT